MFGWLKAFFASLRQDGGLQNRIDGDDCRVATAALLIRVSTVDREMSQRRRSRLHAILKSGFGLDDIAATALVDAAAAAEQSATDLYHFTRRLNDILDHDRRCRIVEMMWEMAYADGRVNEFAGNIIWRAADLLGVSSRERIDLRRRIAAESQAPRSARAMEQIPDGAIESHAS
jgi:uncharacterized tellurite resistance protein B-like protein